MAQPTTKTAAPAEPAPATAQPAPEPAAPAEPAPATKAPDAPAPSGDSAQPAASAETATSTAPQSSQPAPDTNSAAQAAQAKDTVQPAPAPTPAPAAQQAPAAENGADQAKAAPEPTPEPTAKTVQLGNSSTVQAEATAQPAADQPPLQAFAAEFTPELGKPLFAIILQDVGDAGVDRAIAASLPYPVTFAIDPESPFAAEAMALYRAAGKEVIIAPSALPAGASASDVELNLSTYAQLLPESLAVLSGPSGGFQDDLALAKLVIPTLGAQGRGAVLMDKGLNSAQQIAQREGIPFALISKMIDAEGESVPVMRRYLDRAVFRAAQEGSIAVLGTLRPDTLTALTEWTLEGNASAVQIAPISALMLPPSPTPTPEPAPSQP